ncbi:MAG: cobalamin-independent methionine synthase II family protein [Chloroflexota bacterium]
MPILTTTIGAFPKPSYVPTPDWFTVGKPVTRLYQTYLQNLPPDIDEILDRATQEVVQRQVALGIDVPTDGEVRRDDYVSYQCRHIDGFDFDNLIEATFRNGAWTGEVPQIIGPVSLDQPILTRDYKVAQAATSQPVKMTLPGPLTITGSTIDSYYKDEARLGADLAKVLNQEVLALVAAGCRWIQIDEPVFARNPEKALEFGFDNLERCFAGVPNDVERVVHMCCGYPSYLDQMDYAKADPRSYFELAEAIDRSTITAVSFEDAHRYNDLTLIKQFQTTKLIWGSVAIASSRVETVSEITSRLEAVLHHIDAKRLMVAPDCGLGYLTDELVQQKLRNMVEAVNLVSG